MTDLHFAAPIPIWLLVIIAAAIVALAVLAYRRPLVPLSRPRRIGLAVLRALSLAALVAMLARPTRWVPPEAPSERVVPVLVDVSRSMRVPDAEAGRTRLQEAIDLVSRMSPGLASRFKSELYTFGEALQTASLDAVAADARHSDLRGALTAVAERYRGRSIPGIVVLTDGADTGDEPISGADHGQPVPIYALGIGSEVGPSDREVVGLTAGDPRLDAATVDLKVTAVSHGFGREPFELRVLADGRLLESRRLTPSSDGSPVDAEFTVLPDAVNPVVYTAEIVAAPSEVIPENNRRSVLVSPAGRKRRLLALEGAPGFEHSFMARALSVDPSLELDIVVRKGRSDTGEYTFFVQAGGGRAPTLTTGFPSTREALFTYDAVIFANLESDFFTRAQLQMLADFVALRGGGLLVLGGKSFAQRGLTGTPLEEVVPVELNERRGAAARASLDPDRLPRHLRVTLTSEGEKHPVMRVGSSVDETVRIWTAMPELAASAQLGGARPGAQVLALTSTGGGLVVPLVAVQRYGRGRSMVFAGEGAWRWRMMQPATDRSYEFFWRQSARWLSGAAQDPVAVQTPEAAEAGDALSMPIDVRDGAFAPVGDADVTAMLTGPDGVAESLVVTRDPTVEGRFITTFRRERQGLYRVRVEARRGSTSLGTVDRWFHVGGGDREFADPRLNAGVLSRLARASGGRVLSASDIGQLPDWLESAAPVPAQPVPRDLWHEPWVIGLLIALLSLEWILRRRWGLR